MLVAPVHIGDGAMTGSGSVITSDVRGRRTGASARTAGRKTRHGPEIVRNVKGQEGQTAERQLIIVWYCRILGQHEVAPTLVEALETPGNTAAYDSAGIATVDAGKLDRRRAVGKLVNLSDLLSMSRWPASQASATPVGPPTVPPPSPTPTRIKAGPWQSCTTVSSRTSRTAG